MTTARIIGVPGVHTVDANPMSIASLMTAARAIGADKPGQHVEFTFDDATNAGTRTYLVNRDLTLAYVGRTSGSAQERRDWLRSQEQRPPMPKLKRLWQWFLYRLERP